MTAYIRAPRSIHGSWKGNVGRERVGPETLGARTLFGRGYRGETYSIGRKEKDDDQFCHMSWWFGYGGKRLFIKLYPRMSSGPSPGLFEAQQQSNLKCLAVSEIVPNPDERLLLAELHDQDEKISMLSRDFKGSG